MDTNTSNEKNPPRAESAEGKRPSHHNRNRNRNRNRGNRPPRRESRN